MVRTRYQEARITILFPFSRGICPTVEFPPRRKDPLRMVNERSRPHKFFNDNRATRFLLSEDLLPSLARPVIVVREIYLRIRGETLIRKGRKGTGGSLNERRTK